MGGGRGVGWKGEGGVLGGSGFLLGCMGGGSGVKIVVSPSLRIQLR